MPSTHCHSGGEIFYTYFCFLPNSKPICWGSNQRWQWHLTTFVTQPIHKCHDMHPQTHTNSHTDASVHHPYVRATCPFLTSDPNILPDELIHLVSLHGNARIWSHCKILAARRKGIGWEAHIISHVSVMYMNPSSHFNILVCLRLLSSVQEGIYLKYILIPEKHR